jgi:DNA-binding transcriptional regulator YdaS (Cro superfamily)
MKQYAKLPKKRMPEILHEAIQEAVKRAGSTVALGEILGVSQPAVSQMLHVSKRIPLHHVSVIQQVLKMTKKQQRPDVY